MPGFPVRTKRGRLILAAAASCAGTALPMLNSANQNDLYYFAGGCVVFVWAAGFIIYWREHRGSVVRPARAGRDGAPGGGGEDGEAGPAPTAIGWWPVLRAVSRLMPRAAGRRWLAEAESVLFEVAAGRRTAVRSYLLSAPRLAVRMWAAKLPRRARLRFRRPG
jgi:hypothetical protein